MEIIYNKITFSDGEKHEFEKFYQRSMDLYSNIIQFK